MYEAFSLIEELSHEKHLHEVSAFNPSNEKSVHIFEAMRKLMHPPFTPWWNRVWVIQEITVAPRVNILYDGLCAPWDVFWRAAYSTYTHISTCCSETFRELPRDQAKVFHDYWNKVLDIVEL
jgi:hypothetical protein